MARPIGETRVAPRQRSSAAAAAVVVGVALVVLLGAAVIFAGSLVTTPPPTDRALGASSPRVESTPTPDEATATPGADTSGAPWSSREPFVSPATPPTTSAPTPPTPTATPRASQVPNAAPTSAADFDLEGQAIDIGFPLRRETRYMYRDSFLDVRDGPPDHYNHARVNRDGKLVRRHDGVDIYGRQGAAVVAPFSGVVIDPATRWTPWQPERYGLVVAIVSDEPTSPGYAALLVHLDEIWVDPGQHVTRGQVVGSLGRTGYLDGPQISSHLHFELRAPFVIDWSPTGEDRRIDAFDPYPSLVRADPKRQ